MLINLLEWFKKSGQADAVATAITNVAVNYNNFNAKYGRKDIIMSSVGYNGSVRMNPEVEKEILDSMSEEYPFEVPKVFLEGSGEEYYPQCCFSWGDDSVVVIRNNLVMKYTRSSFAELLAKDEEGKIVWIDGKTAPFSSCWDGEYLDEIRPAHDYSVTEYDLETFTKKEYKVVLQEEKNIERDDFYSLSRMVEKELLGTHFKIMDDVLIEYLGLDEEIIIPDGVKEIEADVFECNHQVKSIKIPKTVEKIHPQNFWACRFKNIEIDADNPRYLSKDGLVIDKETQTLVFAHTGSIIPNDGSVKKIPAYAFSGRDDIEEIEIPDSIVEIQDRTFSNCSNIKYVKIPDSFEGEGERIFGAPLVKDGDKYRIDRVENNWLSDCKREATSVDGIFSF